jgi:hypothetical protein
VPTPCAACPKTEGSARRAWRDAADLTPRNARAYRHYAECRAVGSFPDDPLVRRHAGVVRAAEDAVRRAEVAGPLRLIAALLGGKP